MWFNPIVIRVLRSPLHGVMSASTLLFTLRGRKSGRVLTIPANYTRLEPALLLSTSFRHRTWWRNLRGGAEVTARVAGVDHATTAVAIEDAAEVAAGLHAILSRRPGWAKAYGVALEADATPRRSDCERNAAKLVLVRTTLRPAPGVVT